MLVASIMTSPAVTVEPERPVRAALRVMDHGGFRHLPVVDQGRLVGIVSDRDLRPDDERSVGEVMRRGAITVAGSTPIEDAAVLLVENKIGCLPVVDAEHAVIGIVTATDIFCLFARVFGGQQPSTRLQVLLDDPPEQLATLTALARDHGVRIVSLVTDAAEGEAGALTAIVRVATINPGPLVAALRAAGLRLDAPSKDPALGGEAMRGG